MNKKVILGAVVVVGAILIYRHMKKSSDLKKMVEANPTSSASGQAETRTCSNAVGSDSCARICSDFNGSWDGATRTCTAVFPANAGGAYGGGKTSRQIR